MNNPYPNRVELIRTEDITDFEPKRLKMYIFLWCTEGKLSIEVDKKPYKLAENQVITITSGQYHQFKETHKGHGYALYFTLDYMSKTEKDIELIFQNSLFCHFDYNEIITIQNVSEVLRQLQTIEVELRDKPFQYLESVHSRIELLLFETNRSKIAHGGEVWKPEALFLKFLEFVRNNFEQGWSLSQVADRLNTTELKLNELAKIYAGKTAQNVMYGLLISEAKRKLYYETTSIKEIAFQLGFNDPYYFSKFFKNHTGQSPTHYVKSINA